MRITLFLSVLASLGAPAAASDPGIATEPAARAAASAVWSDGSSDIRENPAIHWGQLANGVRYAVQPNATPKGHITLRLLVRVGSLWENGDERGLAHFIKHMAFRGTKRYPKGALLPTLERMGMGLGPDTAAFTGYDFTIYQLELPDTDLATLRLGLDVLREFASEITFDGSLIPLERGVILSEMNLRDTAQSRVFAANIAYLWPGSRYAERRPIGLSDQIQSFTRSQLRAFYDAWYRPERMAVIVVGDCAVEPVVAEIAALFGGLAARAPARPEPPELFPTRAAKGDVLVLPEPGWAGASLFFEHPLPAPVPSTTHAERVRSMRWYLGNVMFARRLRMVARQKDPPFSQPNTGALNYVNRWVLENADVSVPLPTLPRALTALEQEHRKALLYGFGAEELKQAKAELRSGLDQAVAGWGTRSSSDIAGDIARHLLTGEPLIEPAVFRQDMGPELDRATAAECLDAFRELWSLGAPSVLVVVPPGTPVGRHQMAGLLNISRGTPVAMPKQVVAAQLAYDHFGPPGRIASDHLYPDVGVHLAALSNGVRLNFKQTDFEAHQVDFCLRVGEGWAVDAGKAAARWTASGVTRGGLGRHSAEELTDLLAAHQIGLEFVVRPDASVFYGRCSPDELPLALRVVAAYLVDPGFRPDEFDEVKSSVDATFTNMDRTATGPIDFRALAVITGGDDRFRLPTFDQVHALTAQDLAQWLGPQLRGGAVEATIVGDVGWKEASAAAAVTLGAINARPPPKLLPVGKPVTFQRGPRTWRLPTDPTVRDCGVAVFWAAPDAVTTQQERRGHVLAAVLNERIFARLRQQLGETYSPSVEFARYEAPPNLAYFEAKVVVTPSHVKDAIAILTGEAAKLGKHRLDDDTFERARRPLLRERADLKRTNEYWLYTVLSAAQAQPTAIADCQSQIADYNAITAAEMRTLAAHYFRPERTQVILTTSQGKGR